MPKKARLPDGLLKTDILRIRKIEEMIVEREVSVEDLASHFKVTVNRIKRDLDLIHHGWVKADAGKMSRRRASRIRQYELILEKAMEDFALSQVEVVGHEEIVTMKRCPECSGIGVTKGNFCAKCDGEGEYEHTEMREVLARKPGDPAYLNAAIKTLDSITKVEGSVAPVKRMIKQDTNVSGQIVGASVKLESNPYASLPSDVIHEALASLHARTRPQIEGTVVRATD